MARSCGASEASFTLLTESSRLAAGWNLALVLASSAAVLASALPAPLRACLLSLLMCLIERPPPATCGQLAIDADGRMTLTGDRACATGRLRAVRITALWIELRLEGLSRRPVIWRDQVSDSRWAALCRRLRTL